MHQTLTTASTPPAPGSFDEEVGQRLRSAREARDLTQGAVSTRTRLVDPEGKGISRTAVVGYEGGTTRPGMREIRLLCEVLQISPNWLVYGSENPFQTTLPSLELVRTQQPFRDALRAGLAIAALKGHERDALLSLALSLAGRQLGDVRLSGLMTFMGLITDDIHAAVMKGLPEGVQEPATIEALIDLISQGSTSNFGNRLKLGEEGEVIGGTWTYPDPKVEKPDR